MKKKILWNPIQGFTQHPLVVLYAEFTTMNQKLKAISEPKAPFYIKFSFTKHKINLRLFDFVC